jgi:DNA-binding MarR family transcriptional regulator
VSTSRSATLVGVKPEDPYVQAPLAVRAGLGPVGGEPCTDSPDLTNLDEQQAGAVLVEQTARFIAAFQRWMEGRACDGMTYTRLRLLEALHCGGPAIMRDLGTQLDATPRNMTAIVDALEHAGLVVRQPHPTDRRATLVELSPAGARAAAQAIGPQLDSIADIFAELSPLEREQFAVLLTKLTRAIRARGQHC